MERHRIDHWLKLVCLFKQRGDATEACKGGQVKLNGQLLGDNAAPGGIGDSIGKVAAVTALVAAGCPDRRVAVCARLAEAIDAAGKKIGWRDGVHALRVLLATGPSVDALRMSPVRHGDRPALRQGRRARQPVCRARQEARLWRGRYR